jgi:hypothetical protein
MYRFFHTLQNVFLFFLFFSFSFTVVTADSYLLPSNVTGLLNEEIVDVPTWVIGDTWVYEADIYSDSEQGLFDVSSDDLSLTVNNRTLIQINNQTELVYEVLLSGYLSGSFETEEVSGDIQGTLDGTIYFRQADLSIIQTNISSNGIIEWFLLDFDYELISDACYLEPFEYFDFPIRTNESWNMSSTVQQESSMYVETFFDNETSSINSMNGTAFCDGCEMVNTLIGNFSSFHILSEGNGTIESWYNETVKNVVKININQTNETSSTVINLDLNDYMHSNQSITIDFDLNPATASVEDDIVISGTVIESETETPLSFTLLDLFIPYSGFNDTLMTDENGFFSFDLEVPLIIDHSSTTYDIGSDGIIVSCISGDLKGYRTHTLTVIGIGITEVTASPPIQYETNSVLLSCLIYSVDPVIEATVQISGPSGFTPINTSLQQINDHLYSFQRPYFIIGSYSFSMWAKDESGNSYLTQTKTFTIVSDVIPPIIGNITISPEILYAHNPVHIQANITDNVAVSQVQLIITDPLGGVSTIPMNDSSSLYSYQQVFEILGEYTFHIWAVDPFNNSNQSDSFAFTIINDTEPPSIVDESDSFGIHNETFLFQAFVCDNAAVETVSVSYAIDNESTLEEHLIDTGAGIWQCSIMIPENGSILSYDLTAVDTSYNSNMTDSTEVVIVDGIVQDVNQSLFDRGFRLMPGWDAYQGFISSCTILSSVDVYLSKFGMPTGDVMVEVREDDGTGTVVYGGVISPDDVPSFPDYGWVRIDCGDVTIVPGETYCVILKNATGSDTHNCMQWGWCDSYPSGSGGPYDGGWFFFRKEGNPTWSPVRDWDFSFRLYFYQ